MKVLPPSALLRLARYHVRGISMSAVEGPRQPELSERTLSDYFASEILRSHGSRPALTCRSEGAHAMGGPTHRNLGTASHLSLDFSEFDRSIKACARGLLEMGVVKGDRVGVVMGNNSAYAILQWACASIGAYSRRDVSFSLQINVLNLVGVKHLFVVPRIRTSAYIELLAEKYSRGALPQLRNLVVVDNEDVKSLIDWREVFAWREDDVSLNKRLDDTSQSLSNDDVINIQFTRTAKAVSLTHRNILNNALSIGHCMRLTDQDVVCNLTRSTRLVLGNLAAWVHGACVVYPAQIYDPRATVDTLTAEKCTALHGVPTHFLGVLKEIQARRDRGEETDTSRLRTGIAAGSPIPIQLMRKLIAEMNLDGLTIAYGMTETGPVSFQTTVDDAIENVHGGKPVPVGTPGELCVSGYLVQKGYGVLGDEHQTRQVMKVHHPAKDLWMHTGDQGVIDEEGYLKIVGRIKDVIIRGGENLFPVQIENALTMHPGIHEAAAVSVPDEKYGEVVGAWIVKATGYENLSKQEVREAVSTRMNPQNAPSWVWFSDELPKTASGKVMKHVLRYRSKELAKKGDGLVK
ncbi:acetyl-CoA synthetase-like protein [Mucidula mucida]|nr:acetyl-CoA synthetase-like protein [Mucidula mucida]